MSLIDRSGILFLLLFANLRGVVLHHYQLLLGLRETLASDPFLDVFLACRPEVGLNEELRVPKLEAADEDLEELESPVEGCRLPNHVEASREDADEEDREGYDADEYNKAANLLDVKILRAGLILVDDEFGDEDRDHESGRDAHLVGYEFDDAFAGVLLLVDVPLHQFVAMLYSGEHGLQSEGGCHRNQGCEDPDHGLCDQPACDH